MTIADEELRAHFNDLRAEDAGTVPAFAVPANAPHVGRLPSRAWWLAIAATIAIVATLAGLRARARVTPAVVRVDPSILNWTAPTDGLLREARELTAAPRSVFGSVFDGGGL